MIYAAENLKPKKARTDEIILTTAAASSLADHLKSISNLNPLYTQLRDAAWADAQATGNFTPDPRLLANLERIRAVPAHGRFVLVDSGSQLLTMFENGQPVDSMKIIVGTNELPTPLIASMTCPPSSVSPGCKDSVLGVTPGVNRRSNVMVVVVPSFADSLGEDAA